MIKSIKSPKIISQTRWWTGDLSRLFSSFQTLSDLWDMVQALDKLEDPHSHYWLWEDRLDWADCPTQTTVSVKPTEHTIKILCKILWQQFSISQCLERTVFSHFFYIMLTCFLSCLHTFSKSFVVIFVIHHQVYCLVLAAKSPILSYYHITTKNTLYKLQILSPSSDWKGRSIILISMGVLHTNMCLSRVNSELKMSH